MKSYISIKEEDGIKIKTKEIYTEEGIHISTTIKIYNTSNDIIENSIIYYFEDLDSVSSTININNITNTKTIIGYYKSGYIKEQKIYTDSFISTTEYDSTGKVIKEQINSLTSS